MQRRHDRHAEPLERAEHVAPRRPAEKAELMLQADRLDLIHVEEIDRLPVVGQGLLANLEMNFRRIVVARLQVVDGNRPEFRRRRARGQRRQEIVRKGRNSAAARNVRSDEGDLLRSLLSG